jgi:hypothetical protein
LPIYPNTHIVCFGGDVIGYVADKNLWRSTDAGATWERCLTDDLNYWYEKRPIAWENGHVACYRQKSGAWQVAHSANSGATWTTSAIPADPNIYRMPESNPLNAGVAISIVLAYYLLEIHSELSTDYAATWGELAVELPTTAGRTWGCYGATWPSGLMFAPRHDDQLGQMIIWVGEP